MRIKNVSKTLTFAVRTPDGKRIRCKPGKTLNLKKDMALEIMAKHRRYFVKVK